MLEAIGAKKRGNSRKADALGINYQDAVSASLSREADDDAATREGDDEVDLASEAPVEFILPAVDKESVFQPYYPFGLQLIVL